MQLVWRGAHNSDHLLACFLVCQLVAMNWLFCASSRSFNRCGQRFVRIRVCCQLSSSVSARPTLSCCRLVKCRRQCSLPIRLYGGQLTVPVFCINSIPLPPRTCPNAVTPRSVPHHMAQSLCPHCAPTTCPTLCPFHMPPCFDHTVAHVMCHTLYGRAAGHVLRCPRCGLSAAGCVGCFLHHFLLLYTLCAHVRAVPIFFAMVKQEPLIRTLCY